MKFNRLAIFFSLVMLVSPVLAIDSNAQSRPANISSVTQGSLAEIRFRPFVYLRIQDSQLLPEVERVIDSDPLGQLLPVNDAPDADFFVAFTNRPENNLDQTTEDIPVVDKSGFVLPEPNQITSDHRGQMIVYTQNRRGQIRIVWADQKGYNRPKLAMVEFLQTLGKGKPKTGNISYFSINEVKELGLEQAGGGVRPTITHRENAKLTPAARDHEVEGTAILSVIVGADGQISNLLVLRGLPYGVTANCLIALKKCTFTPAMKEGQPVSVRTSVEFEFKTYR